MASISPRHRRDDFEAERVYEYPQHLREAIEDAPTGAGVYIFHGQEGDLPLYIGKSINIRARLLSHLRTPDEARMLRQTQRISHIRTAGEIGALLLEAQMIKAQHPLFNQKLRRNQQLCSLQLTGEVPQVVYARDIDFASQPELYGLYAAATPHWTPCAPSPTKTSCATAHWAWKNCPPAKPASGLRFANVQVCAGATKAPMPIVNACSAVCWRCASNAGPTRARWVWWSAMANSRKSTS